MFCPVRSFMPAPSAAPLTPLPETEAPLPALALPRGQAGHLVAALLPALAEGRPCYCIDGGNCFDPYVLTSQARRLGMNPKPLLERIFISRAYTCHQLLEAITSMLAPLAERAEPPLAVILGLDRLFLDDDIPLGERRRLYSRVVARIKELIQRGLPLLTAVTNAECGMRNAEWRPFYTALQLRDADAVLPDPQFLGARTPSSATPPLLANTATALGNIPQSAIQVRRPGGTSRPHSALEDSAIRNPQSAIEYSAFQVRRPGGPSRPHLDIPHSLGA